MTVPSAAAVDFVDIEAGQLYRGAGRMPDGSGPGPRELAREAFDVVFRPAFTLEELPGEEAILGALEPGGSGVLTIATEDGAPVAAALCELDEDHGINLLSYLAVRKDRRSGGFGSSILRHLASRWTRLGGVLTVGEIHDPRRWPDAGDERAAARLRFYARFGARTLEVPWVQPSLQPGYQRVRDMLLIVLRAPPAIDMVPSQRVTGWAEAYFAEFEGGVPTDDVYRALQDRLGATATIRISLLEAYEGIPLLDA
jgi:GNAT superfamily N-acetyltransferase